MKKQILDALRAKFAGVNDSILDRVADKLAKTATTEDEVKEAVDSYTLQQLLDYNGDYRATEAQKTAVKNYESKWKIKDGKAIVTEGGEGGAPNPIKPTEGGDDNGTPDWAKALIEQNKALTERLNGIEAAKLSSDRRTKLNAITSKLPESLRKAYEHTPLDGTDEEFDELLKGIEGDVTNISDTLKAKGVVFKAPGTSNVGGDKEELTEAQLKAISTRQNTGGSDGQPF